MGGLISVDICEKVWKGGLEVYKLSEINLYFRYL